MIRRDEARYDNLIASITVAVIVIFAVIYKLAADTTQHAPRAVLSAALTASAAPTTPKHRPVAPQPKATPALAPQTASQATPEALPQIQPPAENVYTNSPRVEGVMSMGGKMVALINGDVYEEGQTINGHIIAMITFDSVTIMENGVKKILPIKP